MVFRAFGKNHFFIFFCIQLFYAMPDFSFCFRKWYCSWPPKPLLWNIAIFTKYSIFCSEFHFHYIRSWCKLNIDKPSDVWKTKTICILVWKNNGTGTFKSFFRWNRLMFFLVVQLMITQNIIWPNADPIHWRIYAALDWGVGVGVGMGVGEWVKQNKALVFRQAYTWPNQINLNPLEYIVMRICVPDIGVNILIFPLDTRYVIT